ncbi:MAG: L-sorbosone dehydrogenase, partial [uncultured Ramlibacter sp.]
ARHELEPLPCPGTAAHRACCFARRAGAARGLRRHLPPARRQHRGTVSAAAAAEPLVAADGEHRAGARLAGRHATGCGGRLSRHRAGQRAFASALAPRAAQRRRAGGGGQQTEAGTARPFAESLAGPAGDEARRRRRAERRPHHPAARCRRRWHRGDPVGAAGATALALRHGPGRRPAVCRQRRRGGAVPVCGRTDPDHGARGARDRPAGGPQPPLDQEHPAQPRRPQAVRHGGLEQQRGGARAARGRGPCRHLGDRPGQRQQAPVRKRAAQPERAGLGTGQRRAVDRRQRARRAGQRPGARLPDLGPRWRLLRLALELLGPERRPAGEAAAAGARRRIADARVLAGKPRGAAGARVLRGPHAGAVRQWRLRRAARLLEPAAAVGLQGGVRAVRRRQTRRSPDRRAHRFPEPGRKGLGKAGRRGAGRQGRTAGGRRRREHGLAGGAGAL